MGGEKRQDYEPLDVYRNGDRTLKLLFSERSTNSDDFPGIVALWVCECSSASRDCLILCANLSQLREWLFLMRRREGESLQQQSWRRVLEVKARAAIKDQGDRISGTHLFMVGSITRATIRTNHGEFRQLDCVGVWLVDLVGIHTYYGQNAIAYKTTRSIAYKVATITDGKLLVWEEIVLVESPWLPWLEAFSRAHLKSKTHVIQPPKMRRRNNGQPRE